MTHNHRCTHGVPMYARCSSCEQEDADKAQNSVANQAKPITASDCYSTTPVELCPCARCTSFRENNHRNSYVGMTHNDLMDLVKYGGVGAASSYIVTNTPQTIPTPVAHILQQRLCDELANLSRNVAGLTGVAKQLAEAQTARERANAQPSPSDNDWYWYSEACVDFINPDPGSDG